VLSVFPSNQGNDLQATIHRYHLCFAVLSFASALQKPDPPSASASAEEFVAKFDPPVIFPDDIGMCALREKIKELAAKAPNPEMIGKPTKRKASGSVAEDVDATVPNPKVKAAKGKSKGGPKEKPKEKAKSKAKAKAKTSGSKGSGSSKGSAKASGRASSSKEDAAIVGFDVDEDDID